jgi:DNA-binding response OmpR family regulator
MSGKGSVLIAEDDTTLRNIYEKKFTLAGYEIRTVNNGEEALAELEKAEPDILILDINMPVVDGFGVLKKIKEKSDAPPPFPIIMLTNFADEETKTQGKELGADDYFVKSEMTIKKLLEMVDTLIKAKKFME